MESIPFDRKLLGGSNSLRAYLIVELFGIKDEDMRDVWNLWDNQ